MTIVDPNAAQAKLSHLVGLIESGAEKEITIARNGKPVARLVPIAAPMKAGERFGLPKGQFSSTSQAEFDADDSRIALLFGVGA
jgi:antitoxin (DNA-binding transcriptional repressor) of toxin-antitoxin stability system